MNDRIPADRSYSVGELVDITIRSAVVVDVGLGERPDIVIQIPGRGDEMRVPLDRRDVIVERVAPAEWPPAVGDLWRARDGRLWLCQHRLSDGGVSGDIQMTPATDATYRGIRPVDLLATYGPLEIVYREPQPPYCVDCARLAAGGEGYYAACQAEQFAGPHTYTGQREVGSDWEVCGRPVDDPIHQLDTEGTEGGEQS